MGVGDEVAVGSFDLFEVWKLAVVRHIEDVESYLGSAFYAHAPAYAVDLILTSRKEFCNTMFIQGWLAGV
eukprot:CAMPEP_0113855120 /NCGR_PEP_ID=MMETSP0372-20130328/7939_1 /TAXON_ID=340204 /ORGANISM="Lankesteria abbotti" /LENGTH=69 /DNA_ID=CAMNT_0000828845 /DNA_START=14 /DNA_END=219 /DNA_ORIENTATION=+ /assembly_acc=CAM_ASM_000359